MKKILGIIILGLLWCNPVLAFNYLSDKKKYSNNNIEGTKVNKAVSIKIESYYLSMLLSCSCLSKIIKPYFLILIVS